MTKHSPLLQDEDKLFSGETLSIKTQCERCQTPLILEKDLGSDNYYFMSEYIETDE
jgi:hypothetical protein